ncbi:MAG: cysteine desulfurase [Erysipelotrichaceae bacterium]|nr:cysteine desulfurase [Erysipelotrichaceae bacterium]
MFDVNEIRKDFPMITNHPDMVYFDNSATTYKPKRVLDAMMEYYTSYNSNIERGDYDTAVRADKAYDHAREAVAGLANCETKEVAFLANVTAALNQVAYGLAKDHLKEGDTVLLSEAEHASNLLPWFYLSRQKGFRIRYIPLDKQANVDLEAFKDCLDDTVRVVSLAYVTNVLGSVQPIKEICRIAHEKNILVCVDGAQAIGHRKVDFKDLDADFFCFSSHKMCGPDGVGVLIGKYHLLQEMDPLLLGGGMNARFYADGTYILKDAPVKFEAGTPNIEGVVGLSSACEYLTDLGMDRINAYEEELRRYFIGKIKDMDQIVLYNPDNLSGPVTFNVKDIFAQDVAGYLASKNIAVRSGNHCAKILHEIIGTDQSVRASLYFYNTKEEIDVFTEALKGLSLESAIDVFI